MPPGKRTKGRTRPNRPTGLDADKLSSTERETLAERVSVCMATLGLNINQVAERASINRRVVSKIINAQHEMPEYLVLRALARALKCDLAYLLGLAESVNSEEATSILYIGQAEVGTFRSQRPPTNGTITTHGVSYQGELRKVQIPPVPLDPRLAGERRFAIAITDDHLQGLNPPVFAGQTAVVVALPAGMELQSGSIYLVHCADSNGRIETSFRRVTVYQDRYEFAYVSRDAARNEADKIAVAFEELKNGKIEIGGLFFATVCQYA